MVVVWLVGIVILLVVIKLAQLWKSNAQQAKQLQQIPEVPGGLPFLGHLFLMIRRPPWDTLSDWVLTHGPIIRFNLFGRQIVSTNSREMLRRILQQKFTIYQKDKFTYEPFMCLLGTGLVTSEGDLWREQRNFIMPALKVEILAETAEIARIATERLSKHLEKYADTNKPIQMAEEFRKLTLQVIGEAILSLSAEESDRVFPELYLPIVEESNRRTWYPFRAYLPLPATFKHASAVKQLNAYLAALVRRRREEYQAGKRYNDVLDRILAGFTDQKWSLTIENQLRDEIKTFLFAGHETSSAMLTWTLYELSKNPEALAKVRKEADSFFPQHTDWSLINIDTVRSGLEYTQAALKESLRKYSLVPVVTRQLSEDDDLCGVSVTKNTIFVVPIQAVHNDPKLWPNPQKYDPDRFLDAKAIDQFAFLGFIAGPRQCIGQHFALLETKIVLSLLIQRFSFKPVNDGEKHPSQIPISPKDNMLMTVHKN